MVDAVNTSIGCSGETHVLTLGIDKVAGSKMPVCWREMSDTKVFEYLVQTLSGGKGMDTAPRPAPTQRASNLRDTSIAHFSAELKDDRGTGRAHVVRACFISLNTHVLCRTDRQTHKIVHLAVDLREEPRHAVVSLWVRAGTNPRLRVHVGGVHLNAIA